MEEYLTGNGCGSKEQEVGGFEHGAMATGGDESAQLVLNLPCMFLGCPSVHPPLQDASPRIPLADLEELSF